MQQPRKVYNTFADDRISYYQRGLDFQREIYKRANISNEYEKMAKAIENLKSELKTKAIRKGKGEYITRIEKILTWYNSLDNQFVRNTPEGRQVVFPENIHDKVNKNLMTAYEMILHILDTLGLL